jgi:hypothetical protein
MKSMVDSFFLISSNSSFKIISVCGKLVKLKIEEGEWHEELGPLPFLDNGQHSFDQLVETILPLCGREEVEVDA